MFMLPVGSSAWLGSLHEAVDPIHHLVKGTTA
jgi:hypothetical protein